MAGGIFLIDKDRGLVKMEETEYDSEALLQEVLRGIGTFWRDNRESPSGA